MNKILMALATLTDHISVQLLHLDYSQCLFYGKRMQEMGKEQQSFCLIK